MGFNLLNKAKEAIDSAAAGVMGDKWLAEVTEEGGTWKNLDGWKDQYEPKKEAAPKKEKKEDSVRVKNAKSAAKTAAIEKGVKTINETVVYEMMNLLLECSSKIIGATHEITSKDTANPLHDQVVPLLAALNTVLLSYRFDKTGTGDTSKFKFIRKQACTDMTEIAYVVHGSDKKPSQLINELQVSFGEDQKNTARAILMTQMEELAINITENMEDGKGEKLEKARDIFGGKGENNVLLQFLSFMAVSKLEIVRTHFLAILEEFFASLEDEMGEKKSKEDVQAGMVAFADAKYQDAKEKVEAEVSTYTDMIKAVILGCGPTETVDEANTEG